MRASDISGLSDRQRNMLDMIRRFTDRNGYPPTIRQIGEAVGISSTSVVSYNLSVLQRKGHLLRNKDISRGLRLTGEERADLPSMVVPLSIPLLGVIAAGEPLPVPFSDDSEVEHISLTTDLVKNPDSVYALRVRGTSMIDALINDGDVVVMRYQRDAEDGDMVAAWLKDERSTTLKRFYREKSRGLVRLQPANPNMAPIHVHPANLEIQGKVICVVRSLG